MDTDSLLMERKRYIQQRIRSALKDKQRQQVREIHQAMQQDKENELRVMRHVLYACLAVLLIGIIGYVIS